LTYLSADMVEKRAKHLCLHGEYVRRVPLVETEPVPHKLLEERLLRCAKVQRYGARGCDHRPCMRACHGEVFIVVEECAARRHQER
jgi:hypothetical protein